MAARGAVVIARTSAHVLGHSRITPPTHALCGVIVRAAPLYKRCIALTSAHMASSLVRSATGMRNRGWHSAIRWPPRPVCSWRCLSSSSTQDPYSVLGVPRTASTQELKKAYFALAKRFHPDVNPSPKAATAFRELSEAYDLLRDPIRRAEYDRWGRSTGSQSGRSHQQAHEGKKYEHHAGRWARQKDESQGHSRQQHRDQQQQHSSRSSARSPYADMFTDVWRELGVHDIEDYIERVSSEFSHAVQSAARGQGFNEARAFASAHRGLVLSTIVPLAIVARYPAAGVAALRILGPAFIVASRLLPVQVIYPT
mmetsp:Transcript_23925/g.73263  ORF Transcript_23925/g.73263 Transcript_23925/m.73263 type:complete len:312 (-) Transcript_23925:424-1359(-)